MRVICVNNEGFIHLTLGKKYDAKLATVDVPSGQIIYYYVIDDAGCENIYSTKLFMTMGEYRNKKLEEIGI